MTGVYRTLTDAVHEMLEDIIREAEARRLRCPPVPRPSMLATAFEATERWGPQLVPPGLTIPGLTVRVDRCAWARRVRIVASSGRVNHGRWVDEEALNALSERDLGRELGDVVRTLIARVAADLTSHEKPVCDSEPTQETG